MINVSIHNRVAVLELNRPSALNALSSQLLDELLSAAIPLDNNPDIGCLVIKGNTKVFAAGADIKEMSQQDFSVMQQTDYFAQWHHFTSLRTPIIALVQGYALGGGCELAMMCDIIIASDSAQFGQPEITLGVMSGIGATQRLTRLIGQSKAMELILTGRLIDASEAEKIGLVSCCFTDDTVVSETMSMAARIANYSKPALQANKEAIKQAAEIPLSAGVLFERRLFHSLFATPQQHEGMQAFIEKRPARFV